MSDLFTIFSSVVPEAARVVGFRGVETMSRPYEIEIFLSLRQELGEEFDLADAIGAKARLVVDRGSPTLPPFIFAGVFANIEVLHAYEGQILLRALLVPRLWQLGLSMHSRVFTKMKVPDIIRSVLEENGVTDLAFRLGSYEVEEHVCQYRESDLDFISRWMEREGIFYFFEHGDDGETLVLCDQSLYDEDPVGKPVRYFPQLGHDHSAGASFRAFKCKHSTLPASVRLKDYDYGKPGLNVSGSAKVALNGTGEVSVYGDRFFTPSAGEKLARTRSEELLAQQVIYRAAGTRLHLRPGYAFELEEHPFASFNTRYLTVEAHHSGNQAAGLAHFRELTGIDHADVYQVEIDAIPKKTQFRARSLTAWPRIYGFENGVVDGPADSEYAQIDDMGRYNAKFKFDESKLKNGKATTWVRMMQPHGGDIEGFHFPLRKGTEVMFSFLGGDCDRPVITGVVPNAVNPSPVTLANYTKNVIQTGARNRFELEDKAGSEWIRLSTPYASTFLNMGLAWPQHELNLGTTANAAITAQGAFDIAVGDPEPGPSGAGNMTVHVLNNLTTTVDVADMKTTVTAGNAYHTVSAGTFTELVQSAVLLTYNATKTEHVDSGSVTETFKSQGTTIATTQDLSTGGTMTVTSGGLHTVNSKATYVHTVTGDTTVTTSQNTTLTTTGDTGIITTGKTHIHSEAEINIDTPADITIEGAHVECTSTSEEWTCSGITIENKLDNSISLTTGAQLEITNAIKMSIEAGLRLELNFALTISNAPCEFEFKPFSMSMKADKVEVGATKTETHGLMSHIAGLFEAV